MTAQTLDPHRIQICRVAPINYDNGQPCACSEGTCSLWRGGLKPADNPPMAQTTKERQESLRARRAMLGTTEVRGVFLPPDKHAELKAIAAKMLKSAQRNSAKPPKD